MLLLIEMQATFVVWLMRLAADRCDWVRRVQVNTVRERRVLSVCSSGGI